MEIVWDSVPHLDTNKVFLFDGSITVLQGICGDVNADGQVNVADLTYLVNWLFNGGPPPPILENANVDGINGVNIADLTYFVAHLFQGGPPPVCQ